MAEDIYKETIFECLSTMPDYFFFLLRNKKEMNDVINFSIEMTKSIFYAGLGEHSGNMAFKNPNYEKVRKHLHGLSIAYKFIYPQPNVK